MKEAQTKQIFQMLEGCVTSISGIPSNTQQR